MLLTQLAQAFREKDSPVSKIERRGCGRFHYPLDKSPKIRIRDAVFDVTSISRTGLGFAIPYRRALQKFTVGEQVVAKVRLLSKTTVTVTGITIWERDGRLGLQLLHALAREVVDNEKHLALGKTFFRTGPLAIFRKNRV